MKDLLAAVGFLTILPLRATRGSELKPAAVSMFPAAGLLLGVLLSVSGRALECLGVNDLALSTILVMTLMILTGGLHLDGLADTSDALMSGKGRDDMLRIMRDPHIGTMGVLALIASISMKITLLYSIGGALRMGAVVLMCVMGRWAMSVAIFLFPYARQGGKASVFVDGKRPRYAVISTAIALAAAVVIMGPWALLVSAASFIAAFLTGRIAACRLGGITGDVLGAIDEIAELATLFVVAAIGRAV